MASRRPRGDLDAGDRRRDQPPHTEDDPVVLLERAPASHRNMTDKYKLLELITEYGEAWTLGVHLHLSRAMLDRCARLWARRCAWQVTRVHGRGVNNVQTGSLLNEWLLCGVFGASVGALDSKHFIPTVDLLRLTNMVLKEEGTGLQVVPMSDGYLYITERHGEVERITDGVLLQLTHADGIEPHLSAIVADYDLPGTAEEIIEDSWDSALHRAHKDNIRQCGIPRERVLAAVLLPEHIEAARYLYTCVTREPLPFLDRSQEGFYVPSRVDDYPSDFRDVNVQQHTRDMTKALHNVCEAGFPSRQLFGRVRPPGVTGVGALFFIVYGLRVVMYVDLAKLKRNGLTLEEEELLFPQ